MSNLNIPKGLDILALVIGIGGMAILFKENSIFIFMVTFLVLVVAWALTRPRLGKTQVFDKSTLQAINDSVAQSRLEKRSYSKNNRHQHYFTTRK